MITTKDVEAVWELMRTANAEASAMSAEVTEHEGTTQDILHQLELECPPYPERAKLAKRLGRVRRMRRQAKDQYDLLQPLLTWITENQTAYQRFGAVVGQMRKLEERNGKRMYMCRGEERGKVIVKQEKGATKCTG